MQQRDALVVDHVPTARRLEHDRCLLSDRLIGCPAVDGFRGGVPVEDGTLDVGPDDGLTDRGKQCCLEPHLLFGIHAVRHVSKIGDDVAGTRIGDAVCGNRFHPLHRSFRVHHSEFDSHVISEIWDRRERCGNPLAIVWVNQIETASTDQIGRFDSEQSTARGAGGLNGASGVHEEHHVARVSGRCVDLSADGRQLGRDITWACARRTPRQVLSEQSVPPLERRRARERTSRRTRRIGPTRRLQNTPRGSRRSSPYLG